MKKIAGAALLAMLLVPPLQCAQAEGGKSRVMEDLKSVLSDYGEAKEDTDPHPDALIYKGPAWYNGGPEITIPYLMPMDKALALLVQRPGPASRRPAAGRACRRARSTGRGSGCRTCPASSTA